jgi:hypothetical protein
MSTVDYEDILRRFNNRDKGEAISVQESVLLIEHLLVTVKLQGDRIQNQKWKSERGYQ